MATSYSRGHLIICNDGINWRYADNGLPVDDKRSCAKCKKPPLPNGEDACLGHIPGAKYACCGHGITDVYVIYDEFNIDFNLAHTKEV